MADKNIGLIGKYRVERVDGKPVEWAFVLQDTDPLAIPALLAYAAAAEVVGYVALASDLRERVKSMPAVRRVGEGEGA